jgi:predicted nucleic-acid-binding protein
MTVAVDTNVLVRFLVDDGSSEVAEVRKFMSANRIAVATTVLLETEWVLRHTIKLTRSQIVAGFERLLGLNSVAVAQQDSVIDALDAFRNGCDFADALHHSCNSTATAFATLDKKFARKAAALGLTPKVSVIG